MTSGGRGAGKKGAWWKEGEEEVNCLGNTQCSLLKPDESLSIFTSGVCMCVCACVCVSVAGSLLWYVALPQHGPSG